MKMAALIAVKTMAKVMKRSTVLIAKEDGGSGGEVDGDEGDSHKETNPGVFGIV